MDNTIKMSKKNSDGKIIYKLVPSELCSLYERLGWEYSKPTTEIKIENK